jgi:hypothetical protein
VGKRRIVLVGVLLAGAVGVVSLTGLAGASASPKRGRSGATHSLSARSRGITARRYRINPKLAEHFAVFRQARVADVSDPSADTVANPNQATLLQLDLSATQLVQAGSGPVWIVPGAAGACVMSGQATATIAPQPGENYTNCNTMDGILQNGLVARASQAGGPSIVFGLVPNGNTSVTLTYATGAQEQVPVVNNVVRAVVPAGPANLTGPVTVAFRNAAGAAWSHSYPGLRRADSSSGGQP